MLKKLLIGGVLGLVVTGSNPVYAIGNPFTWTRDQWRQMRADSILKKLEIAYHNNPTEFEEMFVRYAFRLSLIGESLRSDERERLELLYRHWDTARVMGEGNTQEDADRYLRIIKILADQLSDPREEVNRSNILTFMGFYLDRIKKIQNLRVDQEQELTNWISVTGRKVAFAPATQTPWESRADECANDMLDHVKDHLNEVEERTDND